ncbi:ATP-binding protein [Actinacidiphila sp. ITFR-21]|uniref:ATP-binding protein n=1 Tax=Actinacidiphila sp. ITFR-21 TaxID=3075199 RepID=UPI00288BE065|nr:ATP-binding protein [Streptomyces sp. ITFR-21]WNI17038.1 ATP-binding protein [Streptomyces sp. ITFR-21]
MMKLRKARHDMGVPIAVVMSTDYEKDQPRVYTPPQRLWPATPAGVHRARHTLTDQLAEWGMAELADDAALVLSELMTNAHRHGRLTDHEIGTSFLRADQGVILEVHDARPERPAVNTALDPTAEHGRGLTIVDAVTDGCWGVTDRDGPGKVVWAAVLGIDALMAVTDPRDTPCGRLDTSAAQGPGRAGG